MGFVSYIFQSRYLSYYFKKVYYIYYRLYSKLYYSNPSTYIIRLSVIRTRPL